VKSPPSAFSEKNIYLSLEHITDKKKWLSIVVQQWSSIWLDVIASEKLNQTEINAFLIKLMVELYTSESKAIPVPADDKAFVLEHINAVDNLSYFLPDSKDEYTNLIGSLKYLAVRFKTFIVEAENSHFIDDIIEHQLFDVNLGNYRYLVSFITQQQEEDVELSFSVFSKADSGKLLNSINNEINDFVEKVLLEDEFIIGSEGSCALLLNHNKLSIENKELLIHNKDVMVSQLHVIGNESLWLMLLNQQKVKPDWINIMSCLSVGESVILALIDFLNHEQTIDLLTQSDESKNIHELGDYLDDFVHTLLNKSLSLSTFAKYSPFFKESLVETNFSEFSAGKIEILIEKHFIEFNEDNYNALSNEHPDSVVRFIEYEFAQAVITAVYSSLFFNTDEMETLLSSDLISNEGKLNASLKLDESTTNITSDLFELYCRLYLGQKTFEIPTYILKLINNFKSGDISKRVTILSTQIGFIGKELTFELLNNLDWRYNKLITMSWCKITKNKENELLASALEKQGYFSVSKSSIYLNEIRLNKKSKPLLIEEV